MKITKAEVEQVALLARLELTEQEAETFTGQMDAILAYVDKLNELNTDGIVPTAHAVPMENAFRMDEIKGLPRHRKCAGQRTQKGREFLPCPQGHRMNASSSGRLIIYTPCS